MIPQAYITEWTNTVPWQNAEQVEQDLIICRALVEIFSDNFLRENLAFRGGTALHKLYLHPQPRYSEDIDLVQIHAGPIKPIVQALQERLEFLGKASVDQTGINTTLKYRFESETPPKVNLRLKVETNGREHFSVMGFQPYPFEVKSSWYSGSCLLTTYHIEELLGTKIRALYQRRKGRDLFDIDHSLTLRPDLDPATLLGIYREYMNFSTGKIPALRDYLKNLDAKMQDPEFLGDTTALLRPEIKYNPEAAKKLFVETFLNESY